jgi:hypothetical protein
MGYKYIYLEVKGMKGKWFFIFFFVLVLYGIAYAIPAHAQKASKTLTLLFSNNINGEVDPCPT